MTKAIHNYTILTIDKDGKEKRVKAVAKDIHDLITSPDNEGKYLVEFPDEYVVEFFLTLMLEGQAKIEDHKNNLDHIVWAE